MEGGVRGQGSVPGTKMAATSSHTNTNGPIRDNQAATRGSCLHVVQMVPEGGRRSATGSPCRQLQVASIEQLISHISKQLADPLGALDDIITV